MRWYIVRTLLHKEVLRHLANRGGLVFMLFLIVASMLLSFFDGKQGPPGALAPGIQVCYVDYYQDGPFITHLRKHVPPELEHSLRFRPLERVPTNRQGQLEYPHNAGAIQLRPSSEGTEGGFKVWFWYPGSDRTVLAPYEIWFWREALRFVQTHSAEGAHPAVSAKHLAPLSPLEEERSGLSGGFDARSGIATSLVLFGLFFTCVYLLPSLTCEERERGVLLAQALSPASTVEILAGKFLFYPALGLGLATLLAGTYEPRALARPFFWASLLVAVIGSMGTGMVLASLARTQRAASMAAMGYMLAVALLLFICQQNGIPGLPYLALEYHCPRMLHAALTGAIHWYHYAHLAGAALLACLWAGAAILIFRRYGWQ